MKFSCNMVVLSIQISVILSIWVNVENDERLHTTPQQAPYSKSSPHVRWIRVCFLQKTLFLAASLGQNVMSVRENPTNFASFSKFKVSISIFFKLYSYRPSYQTKRTVPHRVPNVLGWSMVKNLLETSKVMIISYFFSGNGILNKKSKAKLLISRPGQGAELLDVQSLTKGEEK